jgi:hypothetical protein
MQIWIRDLVTLDPGWKKLGSGSWIIIPDPKHCKDVFGVDKSSRPGPSIWKKLCLRYPESHIRIPGTCEQSLPALLIA